MRSVREPTTKERVILLHGLAEYAWQMEPMARFLRQAGYETENLDYPSRLYPIERLVEDYIAPALARHGDASRLHFVTHSMGGILVRSYLQRYELPNLGRVAMMAPAHRGSPMFDLHRLHPLFPWVFGPAGLQSGSKTPCYACELETEVGYELGILAGCVTADPLALAAMPWPNDGQIPVESTKLAGMRDHCLIPATHDGILYHPLAMTQVLNFLRQGRFAPIMARRAA